MSNIEKITKNSGMNEELYDNKELLDIAYLYDQLWPEFDEHSIFESAIIEASEVLQVERSMVILSALGSISTAAQGLFDIEQPTKNRVASAIMALIIAESGERKTTVEKQFFNKLRAYQASLIEEHEADIKKNQHQHYIWKMKKSALESAHKQLIKKQAMASASSESEEDIEDIDYILEKMEASLEQHLAQEPSTKAAYKFIYEDTTPMALLQMMNRQSRNACLLSSEANGVFNGHAFGDLHLINTLWDGGDVIVDRVNTDSFVLKDARLTLMLMTQSSVIDQFQSRRCEQARGMGFLARFLVVKPNRRAGNRTFDENKSLDAVEKFKERTLNLMKQSIEAEQAGQPRAVIRFNTKAQALWKRYAMQIEQDMQQNEIFEHHTDHASKLMDNITRIAGLVHYFEYPDNDEINCQTLNYAYEVGMRCSGHFLKHLAGIPQIVLDTEVLVDTLIAKARKAFDENAGLNPRQLTFSEFHDLHTVSNEHHSITIRKPLTLKFNKTDICQSGPSIFRDDKRFYYALSLLMRLGHIKIESQRNGGTIYHFSETLNGDYKDAEHNIKLPNLLNGEWVHVRNLAQFKDQIFYKKEKELAIDSKTSFRNKSGDFRTFWLIVKDDEH